MENYIGQIMINVSGVEDLYQLVNYIARSVKSKSAPSFSSSEDLKELNIMPPIPLLTSVAESTVQ